jgi:hypothetical protein
MQVIAQGSTAVPAPVDNAPDLVMGENAVMHLVAREASIVQAHHVNDAPVDEEFKLAEEQKNSCLK